MSDLMISVIVLTYNQEHSIGRTIDSILVQQTEYAFEIIIGEDASPNDDTRNVCEVYVGKYPNKIRLLPKMSNKGVLKNYSDCISQCRGKYIATCAGDDWWHNPHKLQLQVDFLEANSDYILSYGGYIVNNLITKQTKTFLPIKLDHNIDVFNRLIHGNFISAPTVCYRRSALMYVDFERFIKNKYRMEDYPMWLVFSKHGKFHVLDESLVTYSYALSSVSNHNELSKQISFEENVLQIKRDIVQQFELQNVYTEDFLLDIYYRTLYTYSIKFHQRKSALRYILSIKNKNKRDWVKVIVASSALTFNIITQKMNIYSAIIKAK